MTNHPLSFDGAFHSLSQSSNAEWRWLLSEADPELRAEGLLNLAGRMARRGESQEIEAALSLYRDLSQSPETPASVARRASDRMAVLSGGGSLGARIEQGLGSFVRQASDPVMLLGMGLGAGTFQAIRWGVLARLSVASESLLSRGLAARLIASTAALAGEAPVFTVATRAGHALLGRSMDPSAAAWGRELASNYLALGILKLSGGTVAALRPSATTANQALVNGLYAQGAMLGGLMLVHRSEESLGWRPARGLSANFSDSLATLAQFAVAGRLSRSLMGEGFERSLREMEMRSRPLSESTIRPETGPLWQPALAGARSIPTASRPSGWSVLEEGVVFAMKASPRNGGTETLVGRRLGQLIEPDLGKAGDAFRPSGARQSEKIRSIGILTSGGDGPAENAAIEALVRGAIKVHGWKVYGILDGYRGLIDPADRIRELKLSDVDGHAALASALRLLYGEHVPVPLESIFATENDISRIGGTILRSSRTNPLHGDPDAATIHRIMQENRIDALAVLGGNGSMRAAADLHRAGVRLVGIPQSIDGDVWGSEHSIGFPSAVAKGVGEIHHYLTTAHASRRWFMVEVMGQRYGLLTLAIAERSGNADAAFIEIPRPIDDLRQVIESRRPQRQHGVILLSEGVRFLGRGIGPIEPPRGTDGHGRLLNEPGAVAQWVRCIMAERRIEAQTRSESLGYLLRGADTSFADKLLARHLSQGALKMLASGRYGQMVGTAFIEGGAALRLQSLPLREVAQSEKESPADYYEHVRSRIEGR